MEERLTMNPNEFIEASGLSMSAVFVPQSQSRNAKAKEPTINWRVTITKGAQSLTTDYMQGCAHLPHYQPKWARTLWYSEAVRDACESGRSRLVDGPRAVAHYSHKNLTAPKLADVLYSLVMDSAAIDHPTFESWADDYGYDTDSRSDEAIWRACVAIALQLRQMIDLDAAREAFQDY